MRTHIAILVGLAGAASPALGNMIANGDFQSGMIGPSTSGFSYQNTAGSWLAPVDSIYDAGTYCVVTYDTIHTAWADYYDHTTGDSSGRYMIVNGSDANIGAAWMQTVAVQPNTDYNLSGWFSSLHASSVASLEWRLIGDSSSILSPSFMASTSTGVWSERTFAFNSGNNTSISIQLWDTSGVSSGNDYGVDDISMDRSVPAPGTAALLLATGLVGRRRRT